MGSYGLPGYDLEKAIRLVAETGFDSIEIAAMPGYHGAPDQVSKPQRADLRKLLADSNLQLGAMMGMPTPDKKKKADNNAWMAQVLELATELSPERLPLIQSVLGGGNWDEKKNLFRDSLGPWVELAEQAGITLAIKPHRGHAMSLPEQGTWLIEQLDASDSLKLVYDQSHFAYRDLNVGEMVAGALPHTGYIVMKDAVKENGKVRFALPGTTDTIPHAGILKQFLKGGYQGEICAEVSSHVWRAKGYDPVAATQTCYRNLKKIVAAATVAE